MEGNEKLERLLEEVLTNTEKKLEDTDAPANRAASFGEASF